MVEIAESHNPIRWSNNQLLDFGICDSGTFGDGFFGGALDTGNLGFNLFCGLGGLLGQLFNFIGNHGKPLAGLAGAGRFDGGIQGQKVGLF
jgi:hypothetical protein